MITLDPLELEEVKGNANQVAQLLVKKAIEEEMKDRPFTVEETKALDNIKKNVEIEYFLNLLAQGKVTVNELEILEVYKNNIETLKNKNVIEIFPQLQQAIFNQKLGAEKVKIITSLVEKYDLNDILKKYAPLPNASLKDTAKENVADVPKEDHSAQTIVAPVHEEVVEKAQKIETPEIEPEPVSFSVPDMSPKEEPVAESFSTPETTIKEYEPEPFTTPEPIVEEKTDTTTFVAPEPVTEEEIKPEPFVLDSANTVTSTPMDHDPFQDTMSKGTDNDLFDLPKTSTQEGTPESTVQKTNSSAFVEENSQEKKEDKGNDSSNAPFNFNNFNFKFD